MPGDKANSKRHIGEELPPQLSRPWLRKGGREEGNRQSKRGQFAGAGLREELDEKKIRKKGTENLHPRNTSGGGTE